MRHTSVSILLNVLVLVQDVHPQWFGYFDFTALNIVLTNLMACRVYRNTKFGNYEENSAVSTGWINSQIRRAYPNLSPVVSLQFASNETELTEERTIDVSESVGAHKESPGFTQCNMCV